jgi:hypothetical protein
MRSAAIALIVVVTPAFAERPMTGSEFAAYVGTDTIVYDYSDGTGTADYGPDRSLVWLRGEPFCVAAHWRQVGDQLCFEFADSEELHCWHFYLRDGVLEAVGTGSNHTTIHELSRSERPLDCPEVQL